MFQMCFVQNKVEILNGLKVFKRHNIQREIVADLTAA